MSTVFPASPRAAIRSSRSEEAGSQRPRRGRHARQQPLRREPAGQHAAALLGTHVVTKGKAPNSNERVGSHRRRRCASGHRQRLP
eukprot:scaffold58059_cov66-Phaeocystis_antarctica.AAC.3